MNTPTPHYQHRFYIITDKYNYLDVCRYLVTKNNYRALICFRKSKDVGRHIYRIFVWFRNKVVVRHFGIIEIRNWKLNNLQIINKIYSYDVLSKDGKFPSR